MRTLYATALAFVLASGLVVAQAGSYSQPYTAAQRLGMEFALDLANVNRAAEDPPLPALGLVDYARNQCGSVFTSYAEQRAQAQERDAAVKVKFLALDDDKKAQVVALIDSLSP